MATNLEKQKATGRIQDWYLKHRLKGRGILSPTPQQIAEERLRAEGQWSGGKYFRSGIEKPLKQINAFTGEAEEVKFQPVTPEAFDAPLMRNMQMDEVGQVGIHKNQLGFGFDEDLNFSE
jgi:hypothetical protein